ncbi:hypothetical protein CRG98_007201 [Punica granatum]|uniref:Uncharacterized protein n=1 Tax=Punica granatum TaxID=22663 RepID=A0A2I0KV34_PUNGR|nr:hypothetical protein CRG98_007201 [Punica granatum]
MAHRIAQQNNDTVKFHRKIQKPQPQNHRESVRLQLQAESKWKRRKFPSVDLDYLKLLSPDRELPGPWIRNGGASRYRRVGLNEFQLGGEDPERPNSVILLVVSLSIYQKTVGEERDRWGGGRNGVSSGPMMCGFGVASDFWRVRTMWIKLYGAVYRLTKLHLFVDPLGPSPMYDVRCPVQ